MQELEGGFESFEVTADEGLRAWGRSMEEAFVNAARGMLDLMVDSKGLRPAEFRRIQVKAQDREALLVAWLSELLYRFEVEGFLPVEYEIGNLGDQLLEANLQGDILDLTRHSVKGLVKAATYHSLKVSEDGGKWQVQVVLDV